MLKLSKLAESQLRIISPVINDISSLTKYKTKSEVTIFSII